MTPKNLLIACFLLFTTQFVNAGNSVKPYHHENGVTAADYLPKTIICKVNPAYRNNCSENSINIAAVQKIFSDIQIINVHKLFPFEKVPSTDVNAFGKKMIDITLIYEVEYKADLDLVKTINRLLNTEVFLYAEPKFLPNVNFAPNDPLTANQYFLTNINAYNAWNVNQGDTNVVIGITDTGTDTNHPDLEPNIKRNYADPVNGVDDDGDGYTDNFRGWDVGENDNDPQVGTCGVCNHGSHVSGCADAVTDNNLGVASPGYKCKFLPVKIADGTGALTKAYQGIQYAAAHGCQVINCSWGGSGGGSYGQDIINYASNNKNSTVIAAAGNNNNTNLFYPAAFDNVVAIASTGQNDVKSGFSNYGTYVDVCAPGSNIYSTIYDDTYQFESGTSMASPIAAGCAAIIKSANPTYSANQVAEQLRITADNIYGIIANNPYIGMLGTGRVNLYNALTVSSPSVRYENIDIDDFNNKIFIGNDTIRISGDIIDYLAPTTNLVATLSSTSPYITFLDNTTNPGALATLGSVNNINDPFVAIINPAVPLNTEITFKIQFTDGSYNDVQYFKIFVNTDYINITINDVVTTNTSKGMLCYNTPGQLNGLGFNYLDNGSMIYESGLMIGIPSGQVSDNVRNGAGGNDNDYLPVTRIERQDPAVWSDFDTYGIFNDANNANKLNVTVSHRSMSWTLPPFSKFHIFEYTIKNTGTSALNSLYAGIFSDWDIQTYANNKSDEDQALKLGYVYCTDAAGLFGGTKVLTQTGFTHYSIDNVTGGGGGIDVSGGYTDALKYSTLSTNRAQAGNTIATGNDVLDVVSTGPFNIAVGDSVVVAFALIAGEELGDLQNSATQAQIKYDLLTSIQQHDNQDLFAEKPYPNPANDLLNFSLMLKKQLQVSIEIYELTGKLVKEKSFGKLSAGEQLLGLSLIDLANGMYVYKIKAGEEVIKGRMEKM